MMARVWSAMVLVSACACDPLAYTEELFQRSTAEPPLPEGLLSNVFGSNMVLQRAPQQAMVWGFTKAGVTVTTSFAGQDYSSIASADGIWRVQLPATEAGGPYSLEFRSAIGESANMSNVLFGDVYLCGGQSNMAFAIPYLTNSTEEALRANSYPNIRIFTAGTGTAGVHGTRQLGSIEQPWSVPTSETVSQRGIFGYFSAVCWIFGRTVFDGLQGKVPIGLVSDNWGGTSIETWVPASAYEVCNRTGPDGVHFTGQVVAYMVGPMALTGFTWYQGESNTENQTSADAYACLFPSLISSWRTLFKLPNAYFGFVQLSTWCNQTGIPEMRQAQLAALALPMVGYATNADHGFGCNIHPPSKQYCGIRLGNSALALQYGHNVVWASPTYKSASVAVDGDTAHVTITLDGVTSAGLTTRYPANYIGSDVCPGVGQCAWAGVQTADGKWFNATATVLSSNVVLSTTGLPIGASIVATQYGWGPIPMMNLYDAQSDLPVLPWLRNVSSL